MSQLTSNKNKRIWIGLGIILILHLVGLIGIGFYQSNDMIKLTWINLSISFIIGLFYFKTTDHQWVLALSIAFVLGVVSESIGVKTGLLFGNYAYGEVLGFKLFEVPFTIGLLWGSLNIAAKNWAGKISGNKYVIALLAATFMVVFDIVMEPVAMKLKFWTWQQDVIPIFNYISWFFVSLLIQLLWRNNQTKNTYFDYLMLVQLLFFFALTILL